MFSQANRRNFGEYLMQNLKFRLFRVTKRSPTEPRTPKSAPRGTKGTQKEAKSKNNSSDRKKKSPDRGERRTRGGQWRGKGRQAPQEFGRSWYCFERFAPCRKRQGAADLNRSARSPYPMGSPPKSMVWDFQSCHHPVRVWQNPTKTRQDGSRWSQDGAKMEPRWLKNQDGAKMKPIWAKMEPRWAKMEPR